MRKHKGEHESGILVSSPRTNLSYNSFNAGPYLNESLDTINDNQP